MIDPGSGAALAGSIARAYERQQPWFGYYWSPTPVLGKYDMVKVDFGSGTDLFTGSFYQYLMTAIAMAVVAFTFETGEINWQPELIGALLWMVFGLSVSAILLLMLMIREGEAAKVASYFYLVPPLTAIEAWLLFDEQLNLMGIGAIALTVLGIYLVLRRH